MKKLHTNIRLTDHNQLILAWRLIQIKTSNKQ